MKDIVITDLMEEHNRRVKSDYVCEDSKAFFNWLVAHQHKDYIEIPGYETKSGHAEILHFD
jgi:hypothetical protein